MDKETRHRPSSGLCSYEIAIFDFDSTLVDTPLIYPHIHKELLRELGVAENDIAYITQGYWHREVSSKGEHIDMPAYLSAHHGLDITPLEFRRLRQDIEIEYFAGNRNIEGLLPLSSYVVPAVISDMKRLSENGARIFVVSHNYGNVVEAAMDALGLSSLIEDIYTHCAYPALAHSAYDRSEPKKVTFERLADWASKPSACIVYDDTYEHIDSALSLGMEAVKVDNEHAYPPKDGGSRC